MGKCIVPFLFDIVHYSRTQSSGHIYWLSLRVKASIVRFVINLLETAPAEDWDVYAAGSMPLQQKGLTDYLSVVQQQYYILHYDTKMGLIV